MDLSRLPSPGLIPEAFALRDAVARAISSLEVAKQSGATMTATQATVRDFFLAAAAAVQALDGTVPVTGTVALVANGATFTLQDSTGATATGTATKNSPATAIVSAGALTAVRAAA